MASGEMVPAPVIYSVDIISSLPEDWGHPVTVKVNATDPNSQKLWFHKYASGLASIFENGVLTIVPDKIIDSSGDPNSAKVKIWVWNEDHIVASVESEIPISR